MRRSWASFWGFFLVIIGGLLLMNNLGFLSVNIWELIWPLFLIILGVWILAGYFYQGTPLQAEEAKIPLEGASQAQIHIRHGAGRLSLDAGASSGVLLEGKFDGGLDYKVKREGGLLNVEMHLPADRFARSWLCGPRHPLDWSLGLNREIPLSLDLETGASDMRLNLTDLRVTRLQLKTGASTTDLTLPANAGTTQVKIRSGAASIIIRVPEEVAIRTRFKGGLTGIKVNLNRFPRIGDTYQSGNYESASNRVDLDIEAGVGSIDIR